MSNEYSLFTLLSQLMWSAPTLIVCLIGIIMLRTRAISNKAKNFGAAGLALVALGAVAGVAYSGFISSGGISYSSDSFRFFQMGYSAIIQLLHVVSLIFLIIAICSKDKVPAAGNELPNPYS
jgi:hypothetical protein